MRRVMSMATPLLHEMFMNSVTNQVEALFNVLVTVFLCADKPAAVGVNDFELNSVCVGIGATESLPGIVTFKDVIFAIDPLTSFTYAELVHD